MTRKKYIPPSLVNYYEADFEEFVRVSFKNNSNDLKGDKLSGSRGGIKNA